MAKVIQLDLSNTTAAQRTRVQNWFFKSQGENLGLGAAGEVTADHIVTYLENHVKENVKLSEQQTNNETFESGFTPVNLGT